LFDKQKFAEQNVGPRRQKKKKKKKKMVIGPSLARSNDSEATQSKTKIPSIKCVLLYGTREAVDELGGRVDWGSFFFCCSLTFGEEALQFFLGQSVNFFYESA
jgi:hypothetical protein